MKTKPPKTFQIEKPIAQGRPKSYTFTIDGEVQRARFVPMPPSHDPSEIVCMDCVPAATKMTAVMDNIQFSLDRQNDKYWTIFQCFACKRFSVVTYTIEDLENE